ncbi:ABC transporter permease [Porphyromonas gingivalis]|uniref:ABC transporter permease n=1 Tax=Porphyromonas gingivalis TaxID=837 RepID=UPI00077212F6|nr:ABC transporter permease [Porphyromonas gingivalis]KXC08266.1 hypothetical protein AT291_07650 [Porphyromonas gingivalis]MCE8172674.1 ABC transporter permease [Porphyromonas gingivalis]MCE8174573.1 ABC transporter permease [Porphyromonas gingivalis]MCE8176381.1 ABC transporter permease [Porphyromonas gingivalis]
MSSKAMHGTALIATMRREVRQLTSRVLFLFCMVIAPVFCCLFFPSIMDMGLPQNLPAGIVDLDRTQTSRTIACHLNSMEQTQIVKQFENVREARLAVQRGEIYGYYYIPEGMTRDAYAQKQPKLSFYTNYAYMVGGSLLFRDNKMISELVAGAAARSQLYARGATESQAMDWLQPIVIDTHPIGNPWLNYSIYLSNIMIPGVLGLLIFMVTVCSIAMEIKRSTAREWMETAGGSMSIALLGKLLPQTVAFMLIGTFIDVYLYGFLSYPINGGFLPMLIVMYLFILACQGFGVLMFVTLPTMRLGLSFASLWGIISFSICGASFPALGMPTVMQSASVLFPLRHYYLSYVTSALDGFSLKYAWTNILAFVIFALLPLLLLRRLKHILLTYKYVS